ncbi:hypothetical protein [Roseibium sediminis]|uniref:hypothetical protein n=1 Tax=Roseibium sediminis TaxID=1775174 RepID=UPI001AD91E70|nr:hypothetical protein [Roseibium sediminis]
MTGFPSSYTALRQDIRSGDLIAFRGNGPVSRLIRHVTGGRHTHVGVAFRYGGRLFVLEARERAGVQIRACSNVGAFDWIETGLKWTDAAENFAFSKLGKPYSYLDAVRAGLGARLRGTGYICSEYAAEIQLRCGGVDATAIPMATPVKLVDFWLNTGARMRAVRT